jgi:hypothetical protein
MIIHDGNNREWSYMKTGYFDERWKFFNIIDNREKAYKLLWRNNYRLYNNFRWIKMRIKGWNLMNW